MRRSGAGRERACPREDGGGHRQSLPGKQGGGAGKGRQLPGRAGQPERRGEAPLPDSTAVKGRSTPTKFPARFPASGKCTSHLGFGLGRLQSQVACPKSRAIVRSGRKAQVLARSGMDIPEGNHPSKRKPNASQTQGVQTGIHQSGKDLTQPRTAQRVPVFIPTPVFHVMQVVLNASMAAEQPEHLTGAAPVGREAGQQIPTLFGCFISGYRHSHFFHHCRLLRPGKPQFLPDIAGYFGVGPEPPYLDAVRFFSLVSACGSPSSSSGNPSDTAASKVDRFPLTRTKYSRPWLTMAWQRPRLGKDPVPHTGRPW